MITHAHTLKWVSSAAGKDVATCSDQDPLSSRSLSVFNVVKRLTSPSKHLDVHMKPFKCLEIACNFFSATLKDLNRHKLSHRRPPGTKMYYCPVLGCKFHISLCEEPQLRKDNCVRHINLKHPGVTSRPEVVVSPP